MAANPPDIPSQVAFWNQWNHARDHGLDEVPRRQAEVVTGWLRDLSRDDLDILDVGCGAGWLEPSLVPFGRVTATDLADEWVTRAAAVQPEVTFVAGDFASIALPEESYDVVVTLEVLSHVADQRAFVDKIGSLLRPGGHLFLATQNRPVLQYLNQVPPPAEGQHRKWLDRKELRELLADRFHVEELFTMTPRMSRVMNLVHRTPAGQRARRLVADADGAPTPRVGPGWRAMERAGLGWTLMCRARRR